jgi:hypothetical protein
MLKFGAVFFVIMIGLSLAIGLLWAGTDQSARAESYQLDLVSTPLPLTDEGIPIIPTSVYNGSDEIPPASLSSSVNAPNVLATPVPGETLVYFAPTDNDATATVLYLYNTDTVAHIVALRGYSYNGVLVYSLNINIGAMSFLRLASDSIASAPPPSWATPAPIITNFTDFTYLASLSLPKGVKVEGYTLFNPGTGVVDPRIDQGVIPLRFSTDPSTVFLPTVRNN